MIRQILVTLLSGALSIGYPDVDEKQIWEILKNMSTEEKFLQTCIDSQCPEGRARWLKCDPTGGGGSLGGGDAWFNMRDIPRLRIRGMRMRDGPKGMTCQGGNSVFSPPCPPDGGSPSFPSQITRAATWNTKLEEEIGQAISEIAEKLDIHAALLPTINILPWLNWGRAQESYGEDPYFSGRMGAAVIRGIQHNKKVMATAKHFLANNIENTRWWVSAEMDDKTLHDVYLKAWSLVVEESAPELVMTSYNRVQGKWANTDPKFIDILRKDLGFDGSIMTDWYASWEAITSGMILGEIGKTSPFYGTKGFIAPNSLYNAGVDMEMPFCNKNRDAVAQAQVCASEKEDCVTLRKLDMATQRILRTKLRYGLITESRTHSDRLSWDNSNFDRLILQAAHEGIVLLKNDNILPKEKVSTLAVLGTAEFLELGDHGSSAVKPSGRFVNVLEGLTKKYKSATVVMVTNASQEAFVRSADLVVLDVGLNWTFEGEFIPPGTGGDRQYLTLHPHEQQLIEQVSKLNPNVVVVITAGASIIVEDFVDKVKGIVWMGYPGPLGGEALADILSGDVNPSGKMPVITPKQPKDYLPDGINLAPWALETIDVTPTYPYSHGFKNMWGRTEPRYPFGWGLSYTQYKYSNLVATVEAESVQVAVQVANVGDRAGLETVQVYVTCQACKKRRLPIVLAAFKKVALDASETKEVQLAVRLKDISGYDSQVKGGWLLEGGEYQILVGPAAHADLLVHTSVRIAEQTFSYPGRARAETHVVSEECQCQPQAEDMRIKAWSLPDTLPVDFLLVVSLIRWSMTTAIISGVLLLSFLLLPCFLCWRCCRKAGSKASVDKKQAWESPPKSKVFPTIVKINSRGI